jgi:hypothetical protein
VAISRTPLARISKRVTVSAGARFIRRMAEGGKDSNLRYGFPYSAPKRAALDRSATPPWALKKNPRYGAVKVEAGIRGAARPEMTAETAGAPCLTAIEPGDPL